MMRSIGSTLISLWCLGFIVACSGPEELQRPEENVPLAKIVAPTSVDVGTEVTFDGQQSSDPDGLDLSYSWSLQAPSSSNSILSSQSTEQTKLTPDVTGNYVITLVVSNGTIESTPTRHTLTVTPANDDETPEDYQPPVARAGQNHTVEIGESVMLDGSGSYSPVNRDITFQWTLLHAPEDSLSELTGADTPAPALVADAIGTFAIQLIVNDGIEDSEPANIAIRVVEPPTPNTPPVANAGQDLEVEVGTEVTLDGTLSTDPDDDDLSYHWKFVSVPPETMASIVDANTAKPRLTPDFPGSYVIELVVNDGIEDSEPDHVTITATAAPEEPLPPVADAGGNRNFTHWAHQPQAVILDGSDSYDPQDLALAYQWSFTERPATSQAIIEDADKEFARFYPDVSGEYNVQLVVHNGLEESEPAQIIVTINILHRPVAVAGANRTVDVGTTVLLDGSDSYDPDPQGTGLMYAWTLQQKPSGSNAQLEDRFDVTTQFTPDKEGEYHIELIVETTFVHSEPSTVVILAVAPAVSPDAPVADAGPDKFGEIRSEVFLDASGSSDPNGEDIAYSWSLVSQPSTSSAMLFDTDTVVARLTPDVPGQYVIELTVTNQSGHSHKKTVTVTAQPAAHNSDECLIISEYIEGTGFNKAIELYNCGSTAIDLSTYGICFIMNSETECTGASQRVAMLSETLVPGEVYGICHPSVDEELLPDPEACNLFTGKASFNGDDRFVVFFDNDGSKGFSSGNTIIDAFGESAVQPANLIWADTTYRRCNWSPYDGSSPFVLASFYTDHPNNDFSDFGIAPTTDQCPLPPAPPVAVASAPPTATVDDIVTLDGSQSSDPEGGDLMYNWYWVSKPSDSLAELSDVDHEIASFTPDMPGIYIAELTVHNEHNNSDSMTVRIRVLSGDDCLIFSEYIEGSQTNRALELFNCGSTTLDLSEYGVCFIQNDETDCTGTPDRVVMLAGQLPPDSVYTLCHEEIDDTLLIVPDVCNQFSHNLSFNGDDRIILFQDDDQSDGFSTTNPVVDAFGETAVRPPVQLWQNMTLRRCNWNAYLGQSPFEYLNWYNDYSIDDFSRLGVPPNEEFCF